MKNWIACSNFLNLFLSLSILALIAPVQGYSQSLAASLQDKSVSSTFNEEHYFNRWSYQKSFVDTTDNTVSTDFPDPKSVMYKSMMVPGWGQIVNNQIWKVPIVYGLLGGLGYSSVYLTKKYHDYRAAFYNLNPDNPADDMRFGPTPSYIPEDASPNQLRDIRNTFRNRRDLVYVGIVLAYGLNIVDAYVFAHMRSFDVSEDLSMRPRIQPTVTAQATPGISFSIDLISK